jgi:uncharacterized membrane protein
VGSLALLAATIAYAIILGIGLLVLGTPPAAAETGLQVVAWFRAHHNEARWVV